MSYRHESPGMIRRTLSSDSRGSSSSQFSARRARQFTERMRFLQRSRSSSTITTVNTASSAVGASRQAASLSQSGSGTFSGVTTLRKSDDSEDEYYSTSMYSPGTNTRETTFSQPESTFTSQEEGEEETVLTHDVSTLGQVGSPSQTPSSFHNRSSVEEDGGDEEQGEDEDEEEEHEHTESQPVVPVSPRDTSPFSRPLEQHESVTSASPRNSSPSRSPSRRHERVPGGAAAKLMLIGPAPSNPSEEASTGLQVLSTESGSNTEKIKEIGRQMQETKVLFSKGGGENRRYQQSGSATEDNAQNDAEDIDETASSAAPSFLNPSEIFYENSAVAIMALITPRGERRGGSSARSETTSIVSAGAGSQSVPPKSPVRMGESPTCEESPDKKYLSQPLMPERAERRLENLKNKMRNPSKTMTDLLTAVGSPDDKSTMDLGYMVRRKNACGALQVLTTQPKNQVPMAWTVGVVPALSSVLADSQDVDFSDARIRTEYEAARNRAILALLNLSKPKENRIPVFHTPGLVQATISVILSDEGEARRGCCSILAFLAKSQENRLLLPQVPGFIEAVTSVLRPLPPRIELVAPPPRRKMYPWSSSDSDSESSNDDEDDNNKKLRGRSSSYQVSYSKTTDSEGLKTEDSERTPLIVGSASAVELSGFDKTADANLRVARQNTFAVLVHLTKEKDNAYHLARDDTYLASIVEITKHTESHSHVLAVKLLAYLTRHRMNTKTLVFQKRIVLPALVEATKSPDGEARLFACRGLQNIAQDKSCRQEMATTENLIVALCDRARQATDAQEERLAAVSALKNLCDEPANLIPMTNSLDCISTLMHVAHGSSGDVTEMMQYRACDALATLSHWLRKIATSGQSLETSQGRMASSQGLCVPSLRVVTWNQWQ